jgi:hypothetical protein
MRIARLRRRIDGRLHSTGRTAKSFFSWRTYVKAYPTYALLAGLGAGLVLSAGTSKRYLARWLGLRLVKRAAGTAGQAMKSELQRFWTDSTPDKMP